MKRFRKFFGVLGVTVFAFALVHSLGLIPDGSWLSTVVDMLVSGGAMMAMAAGVTPDNEVIVKGGVEVGDITDGNKPKYIADDLDSKLIQIKPSDFPLDTLTRELKNTAKATNFVVNGFEIGTRDALDVTTAAVEAGKVVGGTVNIPVSKIGMWLVSDVLVIGGTLPNGKTLADTDALADIVPTLDRDGKPIALLVTALGQDGTSIVCKLINENVNLAKKVPAIAANTVLIRLSNAVTERQAQAEAWNPLPGSYQNYCQIHMRQIEETVLHKLVAKNVKYDFNLMRDQVLYEMKMAMERTNWLGTKGTTQDANGKLVYASDGVWAQVENQISLDKSNPITDDIFINTIARPVFENNNGAEQRIFVAGNGLLARLYNASTYSKQIDAKNPEVVLGIKFNRITTPFGDLLIKPMGSLFTGAFANSGIIIDPNYIVKRQLEPLQTTTLELDKTGQARANAARILETYCLMVQNQPVHTKVVIA